MENMRWKASDTLDSGKGSEKSTVVADPVYSRPEPHQAVVILLDSMLANANDEDLQVRAILSLIRMSGREEERTLVGESGCLQAAMTAMRNFPNSSRLLCRGNLLLATAARDSLENKKRISRGRGIEMLIALMSRCEYEEEIQCSACNALKHLTQHCEENQKVAGECGISAVLQRSLKRFYWNKALQTDGISTIGNVACAGLDYQKKLRDCGCIDVIVDTMKRFSESVTVQERCVVAIKEVCKDNSSNQRAVRQSGGVELLTEILRKYRTETKLIVMLCSTLRYICFEEETREAIGRNGALILLLSILEPVSKNGERGDVVTVLQALTNATFGPDANKEVIARCGGVGDIMKVLTDLEDEAEVIESGLRVFRNVSDTSGVNCQLLENGNVFKYAVDSIERFQQNAGISEQAFAIVINGIHGEYDERRIGLSMNALKDVVELQLNLLSTSIAVQKLGRDLLKKIQGLEIVQSDGASKKSRSRVLSTLKRIASGQSRDVRNAT